MGGDYNIYIHGEPSSERSQTSPFRFGSGNNPTQPKSDAFQSADVSNIINTASNPDTMVHQGVGALSRAIPYVAVAMAVIKVLDKGVNTILTYDAIDNGDYSRINKYNNFKAQVKFTLSPFTSQLNYLQNITQRGVQDIRVKLNQTLLGDSVINTRFTGRTVWDFILIT